MRENPLIVHMPSLLHMPSPTLSRRVGALPSYEATFVSVLVVQSYFGELDPGSVPGPGAKLAYKRRNLKKDIQYAN